MSENVTISDRAANRIAQILRSEGDGAMLRISVEVAAAPASNTNSTSSGPRPRTTW
jgi:Fe-S cluster assembly iron-binding protein IscA